jgi:hypothetical protein
LVPEQNTKSVGNLKCKLVAAVIAKPCDGQPVKLLIRYNFRLDDLSEKFVDLATTPYGKFQPK